MEKNMQYCKEQNISHTIYLIPNSEKRVKVTLFYLKKIIKRSNKHSPTLKPTLFRQGSHSSVSSPSKCRVNPAAFLIYFQSEPFFALPTKLTKWQPVSASWSSKLEIRTQISPAWENLRHSEESYLFSGGNLKKTSSIAYGCMLRETIFSVFTSFQGFFIHITAYIALTTSAINEQQTSFSAYKSLCEQINRRRKHPREAIFALQHKEQNGWSEARAERLFIWRATQPVLGKNNCQFCLSAALGRRNTKLGKFYCWRQRSENTAALETFVS